MTTPKPHNSSKHRRFTHPPSSRGMLSLLLRYTLYGLGILLFFITFRGDSPYDVFFSSGDTEKSLIGRDNLGVGEEDYNEYPLVNDFEESDEVSSENENLLASQEEKEIEKKEKVLMERNNLTKLGKDVEDGIGRERITVVPELGNLKFSDGERYLAAKYLALGENFLTQEEYNNLWSLQKLHDGFFLSNKHRRYIPRLAQQITRLQFHETFRQTSTPVIIPFEYLQNFGFLTKPYTIAQLRKRFPYSPSSGTDALIYTPKSGRKEGLDLGPALYSLEQDQPLAKAKGFKRNFPRNLMLKSKYLQQLEISYPPFVPRKRFQPPTLWFGTSTADTKLHSDCCDNFVQMVSGTKRWFILPPTDSRLIRPIACQGVHQSLCWAGPDYQYPDKLSSAEKEKLYNGTNYIEVELKAGDMLYLPAGWWHHIQNLGPTIMVNFWTLGCQNVGIALDLDPTRQDRNDFKKCPAVATADAQFLYS